MYSICCSVMQPGRQCTAPTMWCMKAGPGGCSASAVVSARVKGQGWKVSGLIEMSLGWGRLMNAGSLAIWALGMLRANNNSRP